MNIKIKNFLITAAKEYPFLFVIIYFSGYFYSSVLLIYSPFDIFLSFVFLVLYYIIVRLVVYRFFKDKELVLCLVLWFSFNYNFFYVNMPKQIPLFEGRPLFSLLFFLPVLTGIILLLKIINIQIKKKLQIWVKLMLILALVYPLTLNIYWLFERHKYAQEQVLPKLNDNFLKEKKNIYLFVFDAYTGNAGLEKYWNFNNDEITDLLKNNNFFVSDNALSYADITLESMNSTLNLTKIKQVTPPFLEKYRNMDIYNGIKKSFLIKLLNENDYSIENNSIFNDSNLKYRNFWLFGRNIIFEGTVLFPFMQKILGSSDGIDYNQLLIDRLENLKNDSKLQSEFKYFHFMFPHPPLIYNSVGDISGKETDYLSQVKFCNLLIKKVVEKLLPSDNNIIIIMGDHGSRLVGNPKEKLDNFNPFFTIHLPDGDYSQFSDTFTVNRVFAEILSKP